MHGLISVNLENLKKFSQYSPTGMGCLLLSISIFRVLIYFISKMT